MRKPSDTRLKAVMRYLSSLGASKGGHARAQSLSPTRRSEIARLAGSSPKKPRKLKTGPQ